MARVQRSYEVGAALVRRHRATVGAARIARAITALNPLNVSILNLVEDFLAKSPRFSISKFAKTKGVRDSSQILHFHQECKIVFQVSFYNLDTRGDALSE